MAEGLNSAQKAAMLVMSLGEDQAADLLKHVGQASLAKLRMAAESLNAAQIGSQQRREALRTFMQRQQEGLFALGNVEERFRKALSKAKGEEIADQIYGGKQDKTSPEDTNHLLFLEGVPDDQLASVLEQENPCSVALLLLKLSGEKAGRVLSMIDEQARENVVERILSSDDVAQEVAQQVMLGFKEKLEAMRTDSNLASEKKGATELAGMVGTLDRASQEKVISGVQQSNPELAEKIKRLIFDFEDLVKVGNRSIQELLRRVETSQIALALKGINQDIHDHIFANLSQRARERVDEEKELAGKVPLSEAEEAREKIMSVARQMYRDGELTFEMGEEEYVE